MMLTNILLFIELDVFSETSYGIVCTSVNYGIQWYALISILFYIMTLWDRILLQLVLQWLYC